MGNLRVLVADDHEVVRKGLRTILEEQPGWEVSGEASDGREAVDKVRALKPDVTVVDVGMPGLNGLEATRQMLKNDPATKVRSNSSTASGAVTMTSLLAMPARQEMTDRVSQSWAWRGASARA